MLENIGKFVHFLASGFGENRTGKAGKTKRPRTVEDTIQVLEPLATLITDWPKGFESHVEQQLRAGNPNAASAPDRLGNWYHRLMQFRDPAYAPFKEAVGRVVEREFKGSHPGRLVSSETRDWLPAKTVAERLGVSPQRLVEAVQKGEIAGKINKSGFGHQHVVIPKFEVAVIASERRAFWSGMQAREFLGVGRKQFDLLRECGVIFEVPESERPVLADGRFFSTSLIELVAHIRVAATDAGGDTVAFSDLTLRRTTDKAAMKKLMELICEGTVQASAASPDAKLAEFRFLKSDVEHVLRSERHSLDWTANDVAKLTGWKAQSVTHWCKEGLLESRTVPHGTGVSFLVSPAQLATFQSRFVPVATLAKHKGTTSRKLLSEFARLGINTYGAERKDGTSRGHLIRFADLVSRQSVLASCAASD
ncbi:hypothetical protein [Primorskyibacter sp. S87]|uniref:hypothetical protein n=1 Tax=Primorskyibacter sp. S87 TaxID=3415126 RepID=UPI003C7BC720